MLSKAQKKIITSLAVKKYRDKEKLFIVEGEKSVKEFLSSHYTVKSVYCTHNTEEIYPGCEKISATEMEQISNLKTPSGVLAVIEIPEIIFDKNIFTKELVIALDNIQDPGNLGTIIRLADWFGIKNIICTPDTADAYNPKTVQATMGALTRVNIIYADLLSILKGLDKVSIYGTFLNGENIYETSLEQNGVVIMGNEGKGISTEIEKLVTKKLYIPSFGGGSESLNVAVATAIVCSEFKRRT